jgi:hypothetical protein
MFRRKVIWRDNHAYGERLRRTVDRANVACLGREVVEKVVRVRRAPS